MSLCQAVMYPLARANSEPVLKAATLPGRTSSCSVGPCSGLTMRTVGTVWASVQVATSCRLLARFVMPKKARPPAPIATSPTTSRTRPVLGALTRGAEDSVFGDVGVDSAFGGVDVDS